jgi:hypothetical protein
MCADLRSECVVPAKSEVSKQRGDESILPISGVLSEPRGSSAWIAAGVSALAIAVFVFFKLQPVAASSHDEPLEVPSPQAHTAPQPATPPEANDDHDVHTVLEQAMPLVNGAERAEPKPEPSASALPAAAEPLATGAPVPRAHSSRAARKAKHEELQRRGHVFTLALNLGTAAGQESTKPAQTPVAQAPSNSAEAPAPLIAAPAPKSAIPDNPY